MGGLLLNDFEGNGGKMPRGSRRRLAGPRSLGVRRAFAKALAMRLPFRPGLIFAASACNTISLGDSPRW